MELPFNVGGSISLSEPKLRFNNGKDITPESNGDESKKLTVETVENHVYFYSDVNSDRCLALIREVMGLDGRLRNELTSRGLEGTYPAVPIWVHVHSSGGSLFAGLALAEQLSRIKSPIYSMVEGYAASAATLITMSATKRYILPNSFMLIHELSTAFWGKYSELLDEKHLTDMAMDSLTNFYVKHSKMKAKDVKELLQRDSWFNADECVKLGLVDEILK